MPTKVERMPGSWAASIDWDLLMDGDVYMFSKEEMDEAGTKPENVRVYAHEAAKANGGGKFKTKVKDGALYIQYHATKE